MSRFHVTFTGSVLNAAGRVEEDAVDRVTDEVLDQLLKRRSLIDPDAGAALATGFVEFMVGVDAETPEAAVALVAEHLRSALYEAARRIGGDLRVELRAARATRALLGAGLIGRAL